MDTFIDNDFSKKELCYAIFGFGQGFWEKVTLSNFAVCSEFSTENNSYNAKVHSFSKQCFARSSFDTILGDFQLIFKLSSTNIS